MINCVCRMPKHVTDEENNQTREFLIQFCLQQLQFVDLNCTNSLSELQRFIMKVLQSELLVEFEGTVGDVDTMPDMNLLTLLTDQLNSNAHGNRDKLKRV